MFVFVTGCAGFIGSNLVDNLLEKGFKVYGLDNFSTGRKVFLENALNNNNFFLIEDEMNAIKKYKNQIKECNIVFHLAANADVRFGLNHPSRDLEENTINTFYLLEAMRIADVKNLIFASTGSVYGESKQIPTSEICPFPTQTSLYGASKIAAESFISAYCEGFNFNAVACRFVSLMGPRYTHGHVFDFVKRLKKDPSVLTILGDGKQFKSYFHVEDCINAMLLFSSNLNLRLKGFNPINLGTDEGISVTKSAKIICETLGFQPEFKYTGGKQGWVGDNPIIQLDISKAKSFGWQPKYRIEESISITAKWVNSFI